MQHGTGIQPLADQAQLIGAEHGAVIHPVRRRLRIKQIRVVVAVGTETLKEISGFQCAQFRQQGVLIAGEAIVARLLGKGLFGLTAALLRVHWLESIGQEHISGAWCKQVAVGTDGECGIGTAIPGQVQTVGAEVAMAIDATVAVVVAAAGFPQWLNVFQVSRTCAATSVPVVQTAAVSWCRCVQVAVVVGNAGGRIAAAPAILIVHLCRYGVDAAGVETHDFGHGLTRCGGADIALSAGKTAAGGAGSGVHGGAWLHFQALSCGHGEHRTAQILQIGAGGIFAGHGFQLCIHYLKAER